MALNLQLESLKEEQLIQQMVLLMTYLSIADVDDAWKACEQTLLKALESPEVKMQLKHAVIHFTRGDYL